MLDPSALERFNVHFKSAYRSTCLLQASNIFETVGVMDETREGMMRNVRKGIHKPVFPTPRNETRLKDMALTLLEKEKDDSIS